MVAVLSTEQGGEGQEPWGIAEGGFGPPCEIGGTLNAVKQGGLFAGGRTPLSRCASLPPYCAGGTLPSLPA
jgi:hypothetical protein